MPTKIYKINKRELVKSRAIQSSNILSSATQHTRKLKVDMLPLIKLKIYKIIYLHFQVDFALQT